MVKKSILIRFINVSCELLKKKLPLRYNIPNREVPTMFKKLSLAATVLAAVTLAGCSSQQSSGTSDSNTKSEKTSSAPKKATKKAAVRSSAPATNNNTSNSEKENDDASSQASGNNSKTTTGSGSTTTNGTNSDNNTTNNSGQSTQSNSQSSVNITTADQAVSYLGNALSASYDRSTTQYVSNGKVTWNNVEGYQVNVYSKDSDSPLGSYLVPANGQYFQIW